MQGQRVGAGATWTAGLHVASPVSFPPVIRKGTFQSVGQFSTDDALSAPGQVLPVHTGGALGEDGDVPACTLLPPVGPQAQGWAGRGRPLCSCALTAPSFLLEALCVVGTAGLEPPPGGPDAGSAGRPVSAAPFHGSQAWEKVQA